MKNVQVSQLFKEQNEVLTVREVAQTLRCSEKHIRRMIYGDELACFMIGTQYRVLKKDVVDCFKAKLEKKRSVGQ